MNASPELAPQDQDISNDNFGKKPETINSEHLKQIESNLKSLEETTFEDDVRQEQLRNQAESLK